MVPLIDSKGNPPPPTLPPPRECTRNASNITQGSGLSVDEGVLMPAWFSSCDLGIHEVKVCLQTWFPRQWVIRIKLYYLLNTGYRGYFCIMEHSIYWSDFGEDKVGMEKWMKHRGSMDKLTSLAYSNFCI